jgi:phosphatidylglycerophosphatase C
VPASNDVGTAEIPSDGRDKAGATGAPAPVPSFSAVQTRPWPALPVLAVPQDAVGIESPAGRSTIVFDLDGTLVHGDCGDRFMRWLLRRNPLRWLAALLVAPAAMPLMFLPATRRQAISVFLWLATLGINESKLAALAASFIAGYRLRPIRSAIEALQEEVSRGHRVVVATGALRILADGLLRRLEVRDGVDIVASDIARFAGGWTVSWQCNGQAKLQRLQAEGFPKPYLRAYSDHWSDRWLLAAAGTPVLVNASAKHRQRLRARFGPKLRIVLWQ